LTFGDYTDLETGRALRAEPGGVYDIVPASGRVVPEFPEPWFARVAAVSWDTLELARELASEPEPAPEPEADEQHDE
jgi:hypothetical protein